MFFFFNDTAPTEIYTLSLHDALPISRELDAGADAELGVDVAQVGLDGLRAEHRSEEHTSELQSRRDLVCRLLLEKKKITKQKSATAEQQAPTTGTSARRPSHETWGRH